MLAGWSPWKEVPCSLRPSSPLWGRGRWVPVRANIWSVTTEPTSCAFPCHVPPSHLGYVPPSHIDHVRSPDILLICLTSTDIPFPLYELHTQVNPVWLYNSWNILSLLVTVVSLQLLQEVYFSSLPSTAFHLIWVRWWTRPGSDISGIIFSKSIYTSRI